MDARQMKDKERASGIRVRGLTVAYGERQVFDGFDIDFAPGEIGVVMGGSGVGKSTLLNAIAGLVPFSGEIEKPEGGISYIFQKDRLIPSISVYKNLDLTLRAIFRDKAERRERIADMLQKLHIGDKAEKLPTELSGGESLRVAMARAFLFPSEVLLMDEPFRALDIGLKFRLLDELGRLLTASPRTVVYVTHDADECVLAADRWFVLDGVPARVAAEGEIALPRGERKLDSSDIAAERAKIFSLLASE